MVVHVSRRAPSLTGRRVLITGAARGIGAALAARLWAGGALVALAGLEPELLAEVAASCGDAPWWPCDVRDRHQVETVVAAAAQTLGGLDVVVANAGVAAQLPVVGGDPEVMNRTIAVNVLGTYHTLRAAGPYLSHRRGYALAVSSLAAAVSLPLLGAYSASKAAVEALGTTLRAELRPYGARAGVAYFAELDTDMTHRGFGTHAARELMSARPAVRMMSRVAPLRLGIDALEHGIAWRSPRIVAPWWVAGILPIRMAVQPIVDRVVQRGLADVLEIARNEQVTLTTPQPLSPAQACALATSWPHRPQEPPMRSAIGMLSLAAGCVLACATPAAASPQPRPDCRSAVFETDGYGHGEDLANYAPFNRHVPAGYRAYPIAYQDGVFPIKDRKPLDQATADGTATLHKAVTAFHRQCPATRIVLTGYSEGALVAGDELNALSRSGVIPHRLLSGVLYGDPRRSFGEGGVGGVAGGIETNLPTVLPGVTMRGPRAFGDLRVHEICNENDGICNSANMITNAAAFANGLAGYALGDHGYSIDPVRDIGNGLTFHLQPPRIPYGPPLPLPIPTPWQIFQTDPAGGRAARDTGLASIASLLPQQRLPWLGLLR